MLRHVDIAVFAHNEQESLPALIGDLDRQAVINDPDIELRIRVLCNGCRDRTVEVAKEAVAASMNLSPITNIDNFVEGGKALTWNRYVSALPENSHFVIFMDGDIRIKDINALSHLLDDLQQSEVAVAATSRPTKDLCRIRRNPLLRAATRLTGRDHRDGPICGQLYVVKASTVRQIRLPVPCLVEDGFLSACLVTGLFTHQGQPQRVKASPRVSHYFEVPGSLREFFHHDIRLRLGSELNAALYTDLWAAKSVKERIEILKQLSESKGIDFSIDEHQKHPERSALFGQKFLSPVFDNKKKKLFKIILNIPFHFSHCLYMVAVRHRAKKLFTERKFQW